MIYLFWDINHCPEDRVAQGYQGGAHLTTSLETLAYAPELFYLKHFFFDSVIRGSQGNVKCL